MKRSAIVLAAMLVMALIPSAASAKRPADKPEKPNDNVPTTCALKAGSFWGPKGSADDGELLLDGLGDCNDVSDLEIGSTFEFAFAATGSSAEADSGKSRGKGRPVAVRLGVRNSIAGDWCDGLWDIDGEDNGRSENLIVDPAAVGTVTLEIDEFLQDGNCTNGRGEVMLFDADPGHVVTAWTTGKLLDGSMTVTLTGPSS